jgi:hypothetical protein
MNDYTGECGLSLIFPAGSRPTLHALAEYAGKSGDFSISHHLGEHGDAIAVELLLWGLTFDLVGLAPAGSAPLPVCPYNFALDRDFEIAGQDALRILPGPHLHDGRHMVPVVRAMAALGADLCGLPHLSAVVWHPARSCIQPEYFASIVANWLKGGIFPARGLVGLANVADGAMQSEGVGFFTGQELRIEPELMDDPAVAARIAFRLIDHLVANGPLDRAMDISGPEGRLLRIEPSENGRLARVWSAG